MSSAKIHLTDNHNSCMQKKFHNHTQYIMTINIFMIFCLENYFNFNNNLF